MVSAERDKERIPCLKSVRENEKEYVDSSPRRSGENAALSG